MSITRIVRAIVNRIRGDEEKRYMERRLAFTRREARKGTPLAWGERQNPMDELRCPGCGEWGEYHHDGSCVR